VTERSPYKLWAISRAVLLVMLALPVVGRRPMFGDLHHYEFWAHGIVHWTRVPFRDFGWEYPPGAALVIAPPGFVPAIYDQAFIALMVLADLGMVVALRRLGHRLGSQRGTWLWIAGVTALGPVAFARYDTVSSLLAVLTIGAVLAGAPVLAGVALGGGVVMKLWPALLLVLVPFVPQWRRMLLAAGAVVAATVLVVLAIGGARHGGETFTKHTVRGLQVESIAATPLVVAQRSGADIAIDAHVSSGSWDLSGPGVAAALTATSIATALAVLAIGVLTLRVRRTPERWLDLTVACLLLLTVADKVLSPQYLLWVFGLLCAALCRRDSVLYPTAVVMVVVAALSQVVFPMYYRDLVDGTGLVVVAVLTIRNVLLVAATGLAVTRVWRARTATP
jgi:hypothetical protein